MAFLAWELSAQPKRTIWFFIDGLHYEAPEKLGLQHFNSLIPQGTYCQKSVMIAPHHPTVGDYGKWNTSSFPNPVLHQGSLFISPENQMIQEVFYPKEKTAFYTNTPAYQSLNKGFSFSVLDPALSDSALTEKAIQLLENEEPVFFRIHLQTPGNEGRYLSYTEADKPYFRNIYGPQSPYVLALRTADRCLGKLVESLKKSGKWENTLLVISSDQGQSKIGWHPVADEDSWTTPLLFVGPGIAKGRKLDYFEHTDLAPTIAHLFGKNFKNPNGGHGKPFLDILEKEQISLTLNPKRISKINQQCREYARLRAMIQLGAEKDLYNSSFLTFLENELLTPEPFYHLDRFTEWHKAGSTDHLIEANARILGQMRAYFRQPKSDFWYFDPVVIQNHAERSIDYYYKGIYPKVKYQAGHFLPEVFRDEKNFLWPTHNDWNQSTFFAGLSYWWKFSGEKRFEEMLNAWGKKDDFRPMIWDKDLGNNHLAGDVYLDLFEKSKNQRQLNGIKNEIDRYLALPYEGQTRWWWCDALFMAPPTFLHLSKLTGNPQYHQFAHEKWWALTRELLDEKENLFYRDANYIFKSDNPKTQSPAGKKIFWGRGNGWVLAGTARMLMAMEGSDPQRKAYEDLFKKMAKRVKTLQEPSGCWTVSLYDKATFPKSETSSTALFCFALAWGINHGILEKKEFEPTVRLAWKALVDRNSPEGKLGFVQAVGHDPRDIDADHTDAFGLGAFLFAAVEVSKMGLE